MTFRSPWLLVALVAVLGVVVLYWRATGRNRGRAARLAAEGLVLTAASRRIGIRRHLPFGLTVTALALLAIAAARPEVALTLPERQGTVILAFDVSNSMRATDLKPTRLAAAKAAARQFVERQPKSIRIGIVTFGDSAITVLRPTSVKKEALAAIDRLSSGGGTSLGQGIYAALSTIAGKRLVFDPQALQQDSGESVDIGYFGSATIVLLSDGENTTRPAPLPLARLAATAGVAIHTVGLGTEGGAVVEVNGFSVGTTLNADLLKRIADETDGEYHEAPDAATLAAVYRSIDLELEHRKDERELTAPLAAIAGLLLATGSALSTLWLGRPL